MFCAVKSPKITDADFELVKAREREIQSLSDAALNAQNGSGVSSGRTLAETKPPTSSTKPLVFHRVRPLNENETPANEKQASRSRYKFSKVFGQDATNAEVYESTLQPHLGIVDEGGSVILFAYGHTGTGKTHSTLGYGDEPGLYTLAARDLQRRLPPGCLLSIGCAEIHLDKVYDLVDGRAECTLRDDGRGNLHIRAKVRKDDATGNVYAAGQRTTLCGPAEDILVPLREAIKSRSVGSSSLHAQSSRSHCIVQVEIVSEELVRARRELERAEAELHPVGAAKDTASTRVVELFCYENGEVKFACDGGSTETGSEWMRRFEEVTSDIVEKYRAFMPRAEAVSQKRHIVNEAIRLGPACVTGKLTLCDLAGCDYDKRDLKDTSAQERKESQMINKDLLALKQCFSSLAKRRKLNFRQSKLTRVLKPAFEVDGRGASQAVMLCTTSPSAEHESHAISTLRYGQLFS